MSTLARMCGWLQWCLNPRAVLRSLVALDDTPQQIALGGAIGIFIGLTPTVGIQMVLVLLVAPFVRFNRLAAMMGVYISNPVTTLPLYYLNYKVGTLFFADQWTYAEFVSVVSLPWTDAVYAICTEIGLPLLVGSLIVAVLGSLLTYPALLWLLHTIHQPSDNASRAGTATSPVSPSTP